MDIYSEVEKNIIFSVKERVSGKMMEIIIKYKYNNKEVVTIIPVKNAIDIEKKENNDNIAKNDIIENNNNAENDNKNKNRDRDNINTKKNS